jgi:hypothetical protein
MRSISFYNIGKPLEDDHARHKHSRQSNVLNVSELVKIDGI